MRSRLGNVFDKRANGDATAREPLHCDTPQIRDADVAAVYVGERMAGDFYEFLRVGPSRMLFVLLDVAGLRADTREILVAVQRAFRERAPELFAGSDFNETTAMIQLCYAMNRIIMQRGVRSCPAFIGCYNEDLGTVCYANAGHTPAVLLDRGGTSLLAATGLPLGLFSHTTQGANTTRLSEASTLLVVSRGVVEAMSVHAHHFDTGGKNDFGMGGVTESLEQAPMCHAYELCLFILRAAQPGARQLVKNADMTTLALVRNRTGDAGNIGANDRIALARHGS